MKTGTIAVGAVSLFTRTDGQENTDAPWIILSNSLAADLSMWDAQVALLTTRYRILRYDTRGHGRSGATPGPYDFDILVGDAIAVMDAHKVDRAIFLGLSLGGMTGIGAAIAHPERIAALVCCDARADAPLPFRRNWEDCLDLVARAGGMANIVERTLERWLHPNFRASDPLAVERIERMIRGTSIEGYRGCAAALQSLDYLGALPEISAPALFVAGENDAAAPPEVMRAMAEAVPGARFAIVPDAAHLPNVDNPTGFARAIAPFLCLQQ